MAKHVDRVIQILEEAGFERSGGTCIYGGGVRITGNRFIATHTSERVRFRCGDQFVTVGPRMTCFYRVENKQAGSFRNFLTKDFEAIEAAAKEVSR